MERTQEEKILSGIGHIAVIFNWYGLIYLAVVYFLYREKSQYAEAHLKQALGLWAASTVASLVLGVILGPMVGLGVTASAFGMSSGGMIGFGLMGLLFGLIGLALFVGVLVLAIMAAVKAFKGEEYRYPFIGDFVAGIGTK